jgi:hypothetical protein
MSSRARTPSIESVSEISLHPDDDMYNNLDFRDAGHLANMVFSPVQCRLTVIAVLMVILR